MPNEPSKATSERREDLRNRITELAKVQIETGGVDSLTARGLATKADCAVGAIYNVFDDMQGIVLKVNIDTFQSMGKSITDSIRSDDEQSPVQRLIDMSVAYLNFALENRHRWKALFELEMHDDKRLPQWYLDQTNALFELIEIPVSKIYPNEDVTKIRPLARTLFSAVHGIVALGVERRLMSVPVESLEGMVTWMLTQATRK